MQQEVQPKSEEQQQLMGGVSLLFGTPVWVAELPHATDVNRAIALSVQQDWEAGKINVATTSSFGRGQDASKGPQSVGPTIQRHNYLDLANTLFQPVDSLINDCASGILRDGYAWSTKAWLNAQPAGEYNNQHLHTGGCLLSGVYYVSVPAGSGALVLHDPRRIAVFSEFNQHCRQQLDPAAIRFSPKEGKIILFPSWLEHTVERNCGSELRISIAFNIFISKSHNSDKKEAG